MNSMTNTTVSMPSKRIESLDILRGLTVAGMILVNNGYGESFEMLQHSRWNGLTPCDLVFPFFLFIMGISCYISLVKSQFRPAKAVVWKIVKRTVLLFLIGLFINWFHMAMKGQPLHFAHLRLWAVMQRIALCYLAVSLFALFVNHRYTLPTVALLLAAYTLLIIYGNGYSEDPSVNILSRADRWLFGYDHLYHKSPVDPEGLLGTISSIAHVLLGFYCGKIITTMSNEKLVIRIFVMGTVCIITGYLLTYGLPLNKRIWSPSYVLVSCGLCALLQALLISEELRMKNEEFATASTPADGIAVANPSSFTLHSTFFKVFGMNALALYVLSELLSIVFSAWGINDVIYGVLHAVIPWTKWASLAYALVFVAVNYAAGYLLYRKKIYIKL